MWSWTFESLFLSNDVNNLFDECLKLILGNSAISINVEFFKEIVDFIVRRFFNIESVSKSFEQHRQLMSFNEPRFVSVKVFESLSQLSPGYVCGFVKTIHMLIQ